MGYWLVQTLPVESLRFSSDSSSGSNLLGVWSFRNPGIRFRELIKQAEFRGLGGFVAYGFGGAIENRLVATLRVVVDNYFRANRI